MAIDPKDLPESDRQEVEVQDNLREAQLRDLFQLRPSGQGRQGADALDESENPFELKTTTKGGVSTARDVGPHTVVKWRTRYWLFAKGKNLATGFAIDETYLLHPDNMEEWFASLARFADDLALLERVQKSMAQAGYTDAEVKRITYLVSRGCTLNNPHIPWSYVQKNGIQITQNHALELRKFVDTHPLRNPKLYPT